MNTPGLNHIILTVSDIARSSAFYKDLLGFELQEIADGFMFKCGGAAFFFFPSSHPLLNDRFMNFASGLITWHSPRLMSRHCAS